MAIVGKPNNAALITPSDTQDLAQQTTYLSFADASGGVSAATVYVDTQGGQKNVKITLPAGMYPMGVTRVYATGTTATDIVGFWNS